MAGHHPQGGVSHTPLAAAAALAAIGGVWLAVMLPVAIAPFGDSHDGRNAAVWAEGSRALRQDGPVGSVLGARRHTGAADDVYATHPPAILTATAAAEVVGGERPLATRAPALVASLAVIPLLYLVLRAGGVSALAAVLGTMVAVSTSMSRTFGTMLDTPILGLPVGLTVVLAWLRRRDRHPLPIAVEVGIGLAAGLVAWQCLVAVGLVTMVDLTGRLKARRGLTRADLAAVAPLGAGALAGLTLTLIWITIAYGAVGDLADVFVRRSGGGSGMGLGEALSRQWVWMPDLLGLGIVGLLGALVALASPRLRAPAGVLLAINFGWMVAFPDGAAHHSYWLYWALAPVAFGVATLVDRAMAVAPLPNPAGPRLRSLTVAAGALVVALGCVAAPSSVEALERWGIEAGDLVRSGHFAEGQETLPLVGVFYTPSDWIEYQAGVSGVAVERRSDLLRLAEAEPDDLVLVSTWCPAGDTGQACRDAAGETASAPVSYELITASELASRLTSG